MWFQKEIKFNELNVFYHIFYDSSCVFAIILRHVKNGGLIVIVWQF